MKYDWAEVCTYMKQLASKHVVFKGADDKVDFSYTNCETDQFYPFGSEAEDFMERVMNNFPEGRCNYRNTNSYWDFKESRWALENAIEDWLGAVESIIQDHYADKWNFEPGMELPTSVEIDFKKINFAREAAKLIKAAKNNVDNRN